MNQVAIKPIATTDDGTNHGASPEEISRLDAITAVHITASEMTLARMGITAPGTRYWAKGRKKRLWINLSVSHGHERAKHQDAAIRNTVVGIPGTTTPTPARPTQPTPTPANAYRFTRAGLGFTPGYAGKAFGLVGIVAKAAPGRSRPGA